MADTELVIRIPEDIAQGIINGGYNASKNIVGTFRDYIVDAIKNGTVLPKGHGRIIDIGKIDKDRIERDNPIIYLTVNGDYIEAVSLDYLNGLATIMDADKGR